MRRFIPSFADRIKDGIFINIHKMMVDFLQNERYFFRKASNFCQFFLYKELKMENRLDFFVKRR